MALPFASKILAPRYTCEVCNTGGVLHESPVDQPPVECNDGTGHIVQVAQSHPLCDTHYREAWETAYPGVECPV